MYRRKMMKKYLLAFVVGSSLVSSFFSFLYIGNAYNNAGRPASINYTMIPWGVLTMYGLFNMINLYLQRNTNLHPRTAAALTGAVGGFLLSIGGRYGLDFPVKALNFTRKNEWHVHIYAPIVYAAIFGIWVQTVNDWLGVG
jgi:hypothetical protein